MIEVKGDLWTYPADARVITTNGTVKSNGECVMGRGCALEAKKKWPILAKTLGTRLSNGPNDVYMLMSLNGFDIISFPVKYEWYQKADPTLIELSAIQLVFLTEGLYKRVVLPRPGCGNGGLKWEDVRPILEPILDDRFHVITWR